MFDKLKIFLTMLYLSGVSMQYPGCRYYDFNDLDSVFSFESCLEGREFAIKSYADVSFKPFRSDVNYHLSSVAGAAISCFRTRQIFNLNNYTEFFSMIYLNSKVKNDNSHVMLFAIDNSTEDKLYLLGDLIGQNGWKEYRTYGNFLTKNVKLEMRAYISADAVLGIEYFHIVNPRKAEMDCKRVTTTTKTTATTPALTTAKIDLTQTDTHSTSIQTQSTPIQTQPTPTQPTSTQTQSISTQTRTTAKQTKSTPIQTQPTPIQTQPTPIQTQRTPIQTQPTPIQTQPTDTHSQPTPTMEQTIYTKTESSLTKETTPFQTPCVERVQSNVFNIYNFISFFNLTSKIIN